MRDREDQREDDVLVQAGERDDEHAERDDDRAGEAFSQTAERRSAMTMPTIRTQ